MGNTKSIGIAYSDQNISGSQYILSDEQLGYTTAAQGAVTQLTDKSTAVTLNKSMGRVTMVNTSLASNAAATFQLNNNLIGPNDTLIVNVSGGGTVGAYISYVSSMTAGSAQLTLRNLTAGPLSEAVIVNYSIVHGQ